jgi:ABC-type antimicrobial peptide transport system permease subunit
MDLRSYYLILRSALPNLWRHRMRTLLTCLGIAIGIATVIAAVDLMRGASQAIEQRVASIGANQLWVEATGTSKNGVSSGAGTGTTLTYYDYEALVSECSAIRWAAPGVDCRMQVIYKNRNWVPWKVLGTSPDYLLVRDWTDLEAGEPFTDGDVRGAAGVCLIGQTPLRELFAGESPIGKQVRVNGVPLRVLGVLSPKGANMMGTDQDDVVIAPWTTVKFRINGSKLSFSNLNAALASSSSSNQVNTLNRLYPNPNQQWYPQQSVQQAANRPIMVRFPDLNDIFVSVAAPEQVPLAMEQITEVLRSRHKLRDDQPNDFRIRDFTEISRAHGNIAVRLGKWMIGVAVIVLAAGGVGIMNIMLASVTERTREIGLRMAVGARPGDIRLLFLTEGVLLSLCGAAGGVVLGRVASAMVAELWQWPIAPSGSTLALAVAVSAGVGIAFGYYPAWKASRLDPVEALRYE